MRSSPDCQSGNIVFQGVSWTASGKQVMKLVENRGKDRLSAEIPPCQPDKWDPSVLPNTFKHLKNPGQLLLPAC